MPISLHSHSGQFCKHATGLLEDVIKAAIEQGFISYGLSEHMPRNRVIDLYPEERDMGVDKLSEQFERFIIESNHLKSKYSSQINLLIGIETEMIEEEVTRSLLDQVLRDHGNSIDYLVGSVHHVNQIPIDFDKTTFHKACQSLSPNNSMDPSEESLYKLCSRYFDAQYSLMVHFRPEVIGHFDLCLLYYPNLDLKKNKFIWDQVERNINFGVSYGALFEVNSAALKKGWSTPYPSPDILNSISKLGGRFTLSDDSHGPHQVGMNYAGVYNYLTKHKVQEIWFLEQVTKNPCDLLDKTIMLPRKRVKASVLSDQWQDHPFWSKGTLIVSV
ncbi:polymerase/histidinol phosphatase-like protein [Melampsora americana]|nr:polymerase/histidinol phosphatase-like protein [Melampsora americana]